MSEIVSYQCGKIRDAVEELVGNSDNIQGRLYRAYFILAGMYTHPLPEGELRDEFRDLMDELNQIAKKDMENEAAFRAISPDMASKLAKKFVTLLIDICRHDKTNDQG